VGAASGKGALGRRDTGLGKARIGARAGVWWVRRGRRGLGVARRGVGQPVTVPMDPALNVQNSQKLNRSGQSDE
jgi:hypothetical protein